MRVLSLRVTPDARLFMTVQFSFFVRRRHSPSSRYFLRTSRVRATFMRSTAVAIKAEYEEVLVSSTAVLEANIAAVRDSLNDFKPEVRTDLTGVKAESKSVREDLTGEIKSVR